MLDALFGNIDWTKMFIPGAPLAEIFPSGTTTYLAIFTLLRLALGREAGTLNPTDLLVLVPVAGGPQNTVADDYRGIPDGILLVAVIIFWAFAVDGLGYRFEPIQRFVKSHSIPVVEDGRMLKKNMWRTHRRRGARGDARVAQSGACPRCERGENSERRSPRRGHARAAQEPRPARAECGVTPAGIRHRKEQ
ncbi:MAG: hypothetical protein M3305_02900 [Actinomycetota bacterium]|nr:hypothetical protein [Actinomycetota bacterium]